MRREDKKKHKKLEDFIFEMVNSEEDFLSKKIKNEPDIGKLCEELEKRFKDSLSAEQWFLHGYILEARAEFCERKFKKRKKNYIIH